MSILKDLSFDLKKKDTKVRKGHSQLVRKTAVHQDKSKWSKKDRKQFKNKKHVNEQHVLTNVRLTDYQKYVLANVIVKDNVMLVDLTVNSSPSDQNNISSAVTTLLNLGLISEDQGVYQATDESIDIMSSENLITPEGTLTPEGQKYQFKYVNSADVPELGGVPSKDPMMSMGESLVSFKQFLLKN